MLEVQHAGVDGEVPLLLLVVVVGDAGAVVHAAAAVHRLGLEQQGVGQRGLAGRSVADQGDVADVFHAILGHEDLPMIVRGQPEWPGPCQLAGRVKAACCVNDFGQVEPALVQGPADDAAGQAESGRAGGRRPGW